MKKLPILLLSSLLLLGCVVGCGEETPSSTPGSQGGTNTSTPAVSNIRSVTIQDPGITEIVEGIRLPLEAVVDGPAGSKVTWSSSNEAVATVRNGTVTFKSVEQDSEVTITATSRDDTTKSDSITFTVKDCVINFERSTGAFDALLFEEEGVTVEAGDSALVYDKVYGTKWYVEATFSLDELNDPAGYSKFGLFSGTNENGQWNGSMDANINKNAMFYIDAQKSLENAGFNVLNFVGQNDTFTDWDWGNQKGHVALSNEDKVKMGLDYTLGLLRNGVNYYLFAKKGAAMHCYKHVVYDAITADEPTYAWLGGWGTGYNARDFKAYVGDEVDALYAQPTEVVLSSDEQVLFVNDTYQINVDLGSVNIDHTKLTFESSNPDVATVDAKGLVVAGAADGETTITVRYGDLSAELALTVTSDPLYNVVLDGKMDDAIWSEQVKANVNDPLKDGKIKLYATRNTRGLYIFADFTSTSDKTHEVDWFRGNNIEMTFTNAQGLLLNAFELEIGAEPDNLVQHWASLHSGLNKHNFTDGYLSDLVLNETTGLYEMTFEMFVSYERLVYQDKQTLVKPNEVIGFGFGSPNDVWANNAGYRNANLATCPKITATGIYEGNIPEAECTEHVYGNYVVTTSPSCTTDGEATRTCKWCGHADTKVVESTGEHVWNYDNVTVLTPSTCTTHGVGSVPCTGTCGETKDDVELPLDSHNHSGTYENNKWSCCGSVLESPYTYDRFNEGGWDNGNKYPRNTIWYYAAENLSGDFQVVVDFEHYSNNGDVPDWGGYCWRGVLAIVQDARPIENGDGACWIARMDWHAWFHWMDTEEDVGTYGNVDKQDKQSWYPGTDDLFKSAMAHSNIRLTFTRTGTTIRLDYAITDQVVGATYNMWYELRNVSETKPINIAFTCEFTKLVFNNIYITQ